jgi:hypothetical protein
MPALNFLITVGADMKDRYPQQISQEFICLLQLKTARAVPLPLSPKKGTKYLVQVRQDQWMRTLEMKEAQNRYVGRQFNTSTGFTVEKWSHGGVSNKSWSPQSLRDWGYL